MALSIKLHESIESSKASDGLEAAERISTLISEAKDILSKIKDSDSIDVDADDLQNLAMDIGDLRYGTLESAASSLVDLANLKRGE